MSSPLGIVFAMDIDGRPTLAFEAKNVREASELCKEDWLRADLALRGKQLEAGNPADRSQAQNTLRHWQHDSDLASVRDKAALAELPAEERAACDRLWTDVATLLKKAEGKTK